MNIHFINVCCFIEASLPQINSVVQLSNISTVFHDRTVKLVLAVINDL